MFDELLATGTATIDAARCLNTRHDQAGCRRCVDACPTNAVFITGLVPDVDPSLCVRCGACVPACPTDAVADGDAAERRLLDACEQAGGHPVALVCSLNPNPHPAGSDGVVVRHGRCLASLADEQLLAISDHCARTVTLDLSWCTECPIGAAADVIVDTANAANAIAFLGSGGRATPLRLRLPHDVDEPSGETSATSVIDSSRPHTTRRGMFTALRRRAEAAIERSTESDPQPIRLIRGPVSKRLPQTVPASRQRLLDRLATIASTVDPATTTLHVPAHLTPIADVRIDDTKCSGCGLCAQYCPTGALSFATHADNAGNEFSLLLGPRKCFDCGICAAACPERAISYGDTVTTPMLLDQVGAIVASGVLVACESCGLPTAAAEPPERSVCFSCRLGSGLVTALRDDAGLMADLLGRIPPDPSAPPGP